MNYVLGGRIIGQVLGRSGGAADVADAGQFDVQFTAGWDAPALSPARTFAATWAVHEALTVPD